MREVPKDDKWQAEREANDARRDQYTVSDAADATATQDGFDAGILMTTGPSETDLVIVSLLMRLYDIQMALLSKVDKELADSIYDTHNGGGHFNPQIFIPSTDESDDSQGEDGVPAESK